MLARVIESYGSDERENRRQKCSEEQAKKFLLNEKEYTVSVGLSELVLDL